MDPLRIDMDVLWAQMRLLRLRYPEHKVIFSNKLRTKERLAAYYKQPQWIVTKIRCLTPWRIATIMANGDVTIRNRCFPYTVGNIYETPSARSGTVNAIERSAGNLSGRDFSLSVAAAAAHSEHGG